MGDGWEIENSSVEKFQCVYCTTRSHDVSQITNSEGHPHGLSKFDLGFKSSRQFSGRSGIERFESILHRDNKAVSLLCDVKPQRVLDRDQQVLISSCGYISSISVKEKSYNSGIGVEEATIAEEDDEALKVNSNLGKQTMSGNVSAEPKYQCASSQDNEDTENNSSRQTFFNKKIKESSNLSLEGKTHSNDDVVSLKEETKKTVRPAAACYELHASIETNSAEIVNHRPQPKLAQEKDNSKRKISFRALVRMKGLGRRIRKKHQNTKKREKYSNHRNESGSVKEIKSDSSAKYLLESSTSTSEEQTFNTQMNIAQRKDEAANSQRLKTLQRSKSLGHHQDLNYQNSDELSYSSGEIVCSPEYLKRRRGAICDELEKTLVCGQHTLAELRSILVVQQKLTGFGLL